jgi:hypothetical protein
LFNNIGTVGGLEEVRSKVEVVLQFAGICYNDGYGCRNLLKSATIVEIRHNLLQLLEYKTG